jgi:hypothetical protein
MLYYSYCRYNIESTQRIPHEVLTLSQNVDDCKPLIGGPGDVGGADGDSVRGWGGAGREAQAGPSIHMILPGVS